MEVVMKKINQETTYLNCIHFPFISRVRVFANGPVDLRSIPSGVIPKTQEMVLDASLLNYSAFSATDQG